MNRKRTIRMATLSLGVGMVLAASLATLAPGAAVAATMPFDLYAVTGTTTLPAGGLSVNVWGYNTTNASVTEPGGPTLIVNQGDDVEITLHNGLTERTALLFPGQDDMVPDMTGVGAGGTKLYTFTANRPGTYLYEAAPLANVHAEHQVAMGLYGALIVRPAVATQGYNDASSAFDDEAVLVLSEIDPALNNRANPATFDMRKYAPRYFLINGKVYPNTDPILSAVGNDVLLRYLNAGNQYHSMAVQGAHQTVIALDGSLLDFSSRYVAETIGPGQTADALVKVPTSTTGAKLAIYDGSLQLHNSSTVGSGGMLTFLTAPGTGAVDTGPVTGNVAFSPGTLTATVADPATSQSNIQGAEYYMDSVAGTGTPMDAADGFFDSVSEDVTVALNIPAGQHIVYVRGQDTANNWGVFSSVLVTAGDVVGPATKFPTLVPDHTNGTVGVALHATGNDASTGGSNIAAAEYFIDTVVVDGSGTPLTVNQSAPIASLDATIPAATVNALTEGTHVVSIHSQDAAGNWGTAVTINLVVDKTGPTTFGVSASPNPNNGKLPFNASTPAVRVAATLSDPIAGGVQSNLTSAEGFIDTVGVNGTGFVFSANDGAFNSSTEASHSDIPLATILQMTNGNHTIYVHAKDAAGNWGLTGSTTLLIDKTPPTISGVSATPNPTLQATSVTLSATASDDLTAVTRAEWFRGPDPGVGNGTPMTITGAGPWSLQASINISSWNDGTYNLSVRARDAVGNWSSPVATVLNVTRPIFFSTFGNTNPPGVAGAADDADIYSWSGVAYTRAIDATGITNPLPATANVDGFARVSGTQFYMSFAGDVTIVLPGPDLTVQDEDVVLYNAGAWSVYFDGTAHGLTLANQDLDAISIAGGTLYFSTVGNTNPPGVGGAADDADIYSWNGTLFSRVIDASGGGSLGLPAAANVDGFVRVNASHFYMSFNGATTTVPGLGNVQDEDVVYYNAGTWSVYFDGTAHGLGTSGNLDVDAFDVP